jgi:hypothetical protein
MASSKTISIQANPRKGFFIDMLTRDISLIDCILDLIDNSIDSILDKTKFDPMKGLSREEKKRLDKYSISIQFTDKKFVIEDNSDGVNAKEATEKVFRFGSEQNSSKKLGLSVYGIGMKRAFFKIGRLIEFKSTSVDGEVNVGLDVDNWVKEESWDLKGEFKTLEKQKSLGTKIIIKNINSETIPNFISKAFETRLIEKIQTTYGIFLNYGLKIELNGKRAKPDIPTVSQSEEIKVTTKLFEKGDVQIKILAGITPEDDKKSNGWFIFCNGRMILEGDKTPNTGWGNGLLRKFHASTNRFVGFVYFKSDDVSLLPWTTTKNGVNFESAIYQYALAQMVTIAQPIVGFLTKKYNEDKSMKSVDDLLEKATDVSISDIKEKESFFNADIVTSSEKSGEIFYTVPIADIKRIKEVMQNENISNLEIGKRTFYYFLDHEG